MTESPSPSRFAWILGATITLLVFGVPFLPVLELGFIGDDTDAWVLSCDLETEQGRAYIFTEPFAHFYRPLTALTFAVDRLFFGLNPTAYHATDLLFHLIAGLALFALTAQLTRSIALGLVAVLCVAAHPSAIENLCGLHCRAEPLVMGPACLALFFGCSTRLRTKRGLWLFALFTFLATASKEIGLLLFVPVVVFHLWNRRHEDSLNRWELGRGLMPALVGVALLFVARSLALGTPVTSEPVTWSQRLGVALDIGPQVVFPSVMVFARLLESWLDSFWAVRVAAGLFSLATLLILAGFFFGFRVATREEKSALLVGSAWLAPQVLLYIQLAYFGSRHGYSLMFPTALILASLTRIAWRHRGSTIWALPVLLSIASVVALSCGTGAFTYSYNAPKAATRLRQNFLDEVQARIEESRINAPLVLVVNYPSFVEGDDDFERFSFTYPDFHSDPLGHRILHQDGASRWIAERLPGVRPNLRPLLYSHVAVHITDLPIRRVDRNDESPPRVVVELDAADVIYGPSKTMDFVGRRLPSGDLFVQRSRLGHRADAAQLLIFNGSEATIEPFPEYLVLEIAPEVRSARFPGEDQIPGSEDLPSGG